MLNMQWQRASWSAEWAFCPEAAKAAMIPVVVVPRLAPTLVLINDHHDGHGGAKDSMLPYESLLDSIAVALKSVELTVIA